MSFKTQEWIEYKRRRDIIEIIIKDASEVKIMHFKCFNQKDYSRVIKLIKDKYGYSPEINKEDSINYKKKDSKYVR